MVTNTNFHKMKFQNRLKELMDLNNETSRSLGDVVHLSGATISRYVTGAMSPKITTIEALARYFHVNPTWLMGYEVPKYLTNAEEETVTIDIYDKIPANTHIKSLQNAIDKETIPKNWVSEGNEYIALKIAGNSMYPKYEDGDIVIIKLQNDCENNQDCIVFINGYDNATLKTVIKDGDYITLKPRNPEWQPKTYPSKDIKILGVVKRLRRDF
ncbi:LexA family protein [Anaerovorax odorimutans]|uniref:LexA family protein n=1 Tax=Anaerovorax odorimutans TaxID=109327 RepID=UPI000427DA89|nr:XRE family transcriptional regulator [Anaerovorax odorimutans]